MLFDCTFAGDINSAFAVVVINHDGDEVLDTNREANTVASERTFVLNVNSVKDIT